VRIVQLALATLVTTFALAAAGAPAADKWDFWESNAPDSAGVVDHSLWQQVLDTYLRKSADGINRFAYRQVSGEGAQALDDYLQQMGQIDPRGYSAAEQQAYWINLYNALTVDLVLKYPKKKTILRMGEKFFSVGPWDDKVFTLAGQSLTLNDIEHRILRPIFGDHRVHYAVNCASIGCPNLAAQAYTGAQLESQLMQQERDYLSHERGVTFDRKGRLQLSQIYEWYGDDFGADERGVVAHLAERHPVLAERLASYSGKVRYDYDWDLNGID